MPRTNRLVTFRSSVGATRWTSCALLVWAFVHGLALLITLGTDTSVSEGVCRIRSSSGVVYELALLMSAAGNPLPITILAVLSCVVAVIRGRFWAALVLLAVPYTASATGNMLKAVVARPRPGFVCIDAIQSGFSFPNGHAVGASTGLLLVAAWLSRELSANAALIILPATALLVEAIAWSRVVLGAHYLSDVFAGQIWGALWALTGLELIPCRTLESDSSCRTS